MTSENHHSEPIASNPPPIDDRPLLERLADEFVARHRTGDRPSIDEYAEIHPDLREDILELFPTLLILEKAGSKSLTMSGQQFAITSSSHPAELGEYQILDEIGRGGMGVVYLAEHRTLHRRVALKVLPNVSSTSRLKQRFFREARAAARMHHTNIVPVFDFGEDEGIVFYAMQHIEGTGIDAMIAAAAASQEDQSPATENVDAHSRIGDFLNDSLAISADPSGSGSGTRSRRWRQIARIGKQTANAIDYAHRQGVLHRDIKPANLILDGDFNVWVTDFGLAKSAEDVDLTQTGDFVGSLRYLAPEAIDGRADERSDVCGIGLVLYEMAALRPAFDGADRHQLLRQIIEEGAPPLNRLRPDVPRDLVVIIQKAIDRDPNARYQSAKKLEEDLGRFIADQPIRARPVSPLNHLWKWARRNRALSSLIGTVAALLILLLVGSLIFSIQISKVAAERGTAINDLQQQEQRTLEERDLARKRLFESRLNEVAARRASGEAGQHFAALRAAGEAAKQLDQFDATEEQLFELRSEVIGCLGLVDVKEIASWKDPRHKRSMFDFSPDMTLYMTQQSVGSPIRIYKVDELIRTGATSKCSPSIEFDGGSKAFGLQFSPSGRYVISTCFKSSTVFDLETEQIVHVQESSAPVSIGKRGEDSILAVAEKGQIQLLKLPNLNPLETIPEVLPSTHYLRMHWSPSGEHLVLNEATKMQVVDTRTGDSVWNVKLKGWTTEARWHPHREWIAIGVENDVQFWQVGGLEPLREFQGHVNRAYRLQFTPNGRTLVTTSWGNTSRFWDVHSGEHLFATAESFNRISNDGSKIGFVGDKTGIWEFHSGELRKTVTSPDSPPTHANIPRDLAVHPGNRWTILSQAQGLRLSDLHSGSKIVDIPQYRVTSVRFHPDGKSFFAAGSQVWQWPFHEETLPSGDLRLVIGPPTEVVDKKWTLSLSNHYSDLDLDNTGQFLAIESLNTYLIDLSRPGESPRQMPSQGNALDVAVSPGGKFVAVGNHHGAGAEVFDGATGERVKYIHSPGPARVALSPDGQLLVATFDGDAEIYDTSDWRQLYRIDETGMELSWAAEFSDDSRYLVLNMSNPRSALICDSRTGRKLARIPGRAGTVPRDAASQMTTNGILVQIQAGNGVEAWDIQEARRHLAELGLDWKDQHETVNKTALKNLASQQSVQVDVQWGEHLRPILENALRKSESDTRALEVSRQMIDKWRTDWPGNLTVLEVEAHWLMNRKAYGEAKDRLTKSILSSVDPAAELFGLRGRFWRFLGDPEKCVTDLRQYAESIGNEQPRARTFNSLAWVLFIHPQWELEAGESLRFAERAIELDPNTSSIRQTYAAALIRNREYEAALNELNSIVPNDGSRGKGAYGDGFLMAITLAKLGREEEALTWYQRELGYYVRSFTDPEYGRSVFSNTRVYDWQAMRAFAERVLDTKPENTLRNDLHYLGLELGPMQWNGFQLAANAHADSGRIEVQNFMAWRKTIQVLGEASWTESATNLFWTPRGKGALLEIDIDAPTTGEYDGLLGLVEGTDYGKVECSLNFQSIGQFDGRSRKVTIGRGLRFESVRLQAGKNTLRLRTLEKSAASNGYNVGVAYLELKPRSD